MGTRVFSTRLSEQVLAEMDRAVERRKITKREFLEKAIHEEAKVDEKAAFMAILEATFGTLNIPGETTEETIEKMRRESEKSWGRHSEVLGRIGTEPP